MNKWLISLALISQLFACNIDKTDMTGKWYLDSSLYNDEFGYMELEISQDSIFVDLETHNRSSGIFIKGDSINFLQFKGTFELLIPDTLILYDQFGSVFRFIRFIEKENGYLTAGDLYQIRRFIYYCKHLGDDDLETIEILKEGLWSRFKYRNENLENELTIESTLK